MACCCPCSPACPCSASATWERSDDHFRVDFGMHGQYLAASAMLLLTFRPPTAFWIAIATLCISTLLSGSAAQAQSTRREVLDAERAKKAQGLTAPKASGLEKRVLRVE